MISIPSASSASATSAIGTAGMADRVRRQPASGRRPGRPRVGRSPRSTRHVKLEIADDETLCRVSNRSGVAINALIKLAVRTFLDQAVVTISGRQINTAASKPS
jgi:hypothetical protein